MLCHRQNDQFCVISLADGVSACGEARRGAAVAAEAVTNLLLKKAEHFLEYEEEKAADFILSHVLFELKREAEARSRPVEDFSSTLASVLVDKNRRRMLCFNLGDGIILAAGRGKIRTLCMPMDSADGCCVTTTRGADTAAAVRRYALGSMDSVLICSDGAWTHMFSKSRLRPEVSELLANSRFDMLGSYLDGQNCSDDYSFISLNLHRGERKKCA